MDLDRLRKLAVSGDRDAAVQLRAEGERRGDVSLAIEAHAALGDRAGLLEVLERAWVEEDFVTVEAVGRVFGLVLDRATCAALNALYKDVRGRKRHCVLPFQRVLDLLERARSSADGWTHERADSTRYGFPVMAVLAVRDEDEKRMVFGLTWMAARRAPGQYRLSDPVWHGELADCWPVNDRESLWDAWSEGTHHRIEVSLCPRSLLERRRSEAWHEALELLLTLPASHRWDWDVLTRLLAAWPEALEPELIGTIQAALDASWPDRICTRTIAPADLSHVRCTAPVVALPVVRTLQVRAIPEELEQLGAIEGLERVRGLTLSTYWEWRFHPTQAEPLLDAVCATPLLRNATRLALSPRDPVVEALAARPDMLQRFTAIELFRDFPMSEVSEAVAGSAVGLLAASPALTALTAEARLVATLAAMDAFARLDGLRELTMTDHVVSDSEIGTVLDACRRPLRVLEATQYPRRAMAQVARSRHVSTPERLVLCETRREGAREGFAALCERLEAIEYLALRFSDTRGSVSWAPLADAAWLSRLRSLTLSGLALGADGARALVEAAPDLRLRELHLHACGLGNDGLAVLCEAGWLEALEILRLPDNDLTGAGIKQLVCSPRAPRALRVLDLGDNKLGVTGARALAAWRPARSVVRLQVGQVGRRGVDLLNASPNVRGELDGNSTGLRAAPWVQLIEGAP